jgi:hypothetical protein
MDVAVDQTGKQEFSLPLDCFDVDALKLDLARFADGFDPVPRDQNIFQPKRAGRIHPGLADEDGHAFLLLEAVGIKLS